MDSKKNKRKLKKSIKKTYEDFSGYVVDKSKKVNFKSMQVLACLGDAIAIEYEAKKHSDRKAHIYRHEFEGKTELYTNGKELIIYGKDIEITSRGIEG